MIFDKLNTPYIFTSRIPEAYKTILFISWFIFLFVYLFRADNFPQSDSNFYRLYFSFLYGGCTFIVAMFNTLVFSQLVSPNKEKNWKVWNEIVLYLIHFITISIAIYFISHYISKQPLSISGLLQSILTTCLIGVIPVSIHVLNQQRKLFKKYYQMASEIQTGSVSQSSGSQEETINLNGEVYTVNDVLFVESDRNYLHVYLSGDKKETIRFTLKEMEVLLSKYPQFIRCHRAYMINANRIAKIEGNAQGLKLYLDEISSYVPVSRSYIERVSSVIRPCK